MDQPHTGHAQVLSQPPERQVIATEHAPTAVGPYSQGIRVEDLIFTAGQLGIDPATGRLVEGGVEAQAHQALTNLQAVLKAAGGSLDRAVKMTVFMVDISNFGAVNQIYGQFFSQDPPARSAVEVAALPLGGLVMIEAIAVR
jgi:2-iminobutanoate/2-iminopropanoate deaminase